MKAGINVKKGNSLGIRNKHGITRITVEDDSFEVFVQPTPPVRILFSSKEKEKAIKRVLREIEELSIMSNEPAFRIHYKDGRVILVIVTSKKLEIKCYKQDYQEDPMSVVPIIRRISIPQKIGA